MKIEERLIRRTTEDIIEIGNILEKFYGSSAGAILRAIINGRISEAISNKFDNETNADRRLGWAEGYQTIINDIEQAIQDKEKLVSPIQEG